MPTIIAVVTIPLMHNAEENPVHNHTTAVDGKKITNIKTRLGGHSKNKTKIISDPVAFAGLFLVLRDELGRLLLEVPLKYILDATADNSGYDFVAFTPKWADSKLVSYNPGAIVEGEVVELLIEAY